MQHIRLEGFVPPLVTPLTGDGSLDAGSMRRLIERVVQAGARAVFVLGTSGEFTLLDPSTQRAVIQSAVAQSGGRVPVLVGVSDHGVPGVLEKAGWAQEAGADGLVVTPPFYFPFSQGEVESFIEGLLARTALPVILYNIPQLAQTGFSVELATRLASHPRVVGIKDSSGDFIYFQRLIEAIKPVRPEFGIMQGRESLAAASLLMGADGIVPGLGNLAPGLCARLVEAARAGDLPGARLLQAKLSALETLYSVGPKAISGLKAALALQGLAPAELAPPNAPLGEEGVAKVRAILAAHFESEEGGVELARPM